MSRVFRPSDEAQPAVFGDVSVVARQERERIFGPPQATPEAQALMEDAAEEARRILGDAIVSGERMKADAHQEGYRNGYSEGYAAGREAAFTELAEERAAYQRELDALVATIEEARKRIWVEAEPQIVQFVLDVARKVVKEQADVDRKIVLSVVGNVLRRIVSKERVSIRVNSADIEAVRESREELIASLDSIGKLEIVEDRRVSPGGCVLETDDGTIDARIETQFDELATILDRALPEAA